MHQRMSVGDLKVSPKDGGRTNSQIRFMAEGVISALKTPLKISLLPRKLDFELRLAKLKADDCVISGLKEILNCDIGKFDSVRSVFETASFFTDILNSCQEKLSTIDLDSRHETVEVQSLCESGVGTVRHDSPLPDESSCRGSCSVLYGHSELIPELSTITPQSRKLWKLKTSDQFFCDNECEFHLKSEEVKFTAIVTPPVTRGDHKTLDVSSFLALNDFCEHCSKTPIQVHAFPKSKLKDEETLSRTLLKFRKAARNLSSESNPTRNVSGTKRYKVNRENCMQSADGEDSDDSGVFKRYIKKKVINIHPNITVKNNKQGCLSPRQSTSHAINNKESGMRVNSMGAPGFTDLPVVKKSLSKLTSRNKNELVEPNVSDNVIGVSYPPRENNSLISIPNGNIPVRSPPNYFEDSSIQKSKRKRLAVSPLDKEFESKSGRKVYVCKDDERAILQLLKAGKKKKKKKLKKKGKKLSISLSPPPGQDLDDYLQQQLILIKAQLAVKKDAELEVIRGKLLNSQKAQSSIDSCHTKSEDTSARPLEYEQVNHILGDLPRSDDRGALVVYKPAVKKSDSPTNRKSPLFISRDRLSPHKPESYAYPSTDIKYKRRSPQKTQVRDYREREYRSKYKKRSESPPHYRDSQHHHRTRERIMYSPNNDRKIQRRSPSNLKSKSSTSNRSPGLNIKNDDRHASNKSRDSRVDLSRDRNDDVLEKEKKERKKSKENGIISAVHKKLLHNKLDVSTLLGQESSNGSRVKKTNEFKEPRININELPPGVDESDFYRSQSPVVEMPISPDPVFKKTSPITISEDEPLLTVSEDSNSGINLASKVEGKSCQRRNDSSHITNASNSLKIRSHSRSRSRSMSFSSDESSKQSKRKARTRSERRRRSINYERGSRARTPSPSVTNENYSYRTKVVEVKKTISSSALSSKDVSPKTMQQLETTTVYEYQALEGVHYPPTSHYPNPNMYPPLNYQYQHPYPYYQQPMVPYPAPPYQPRPYF